MDYLYKALLLYSNLDVLTYNILSLLGDDTMDKSRDHQSSVAPSCESQRNTPPHINLPPEHASQTFHGVVSGLVRIN